MGNKPTRYYSKKQEECVANYLDGQLTLNSGATNFQKGDILLDNTIVECKTKTEPSQTHSIKWQWINNLKKEAISMGKQNWAIIFDFGTQKLQDQYVIIPIDDYKEYLEYKKGSE